MSTQSFTGEYHFDQQLCRQCRGLCCQAHPGVWVDPERFWAIFFAGRPASSKNIADRLAELGLELRDYSGVPVPAPRSSHAGCDFLGPSGCRLPRARRPCQCLALEPVLATLIEGEIHCRLPKGYSYGPIRQHWGRFWQRVGSGSDHSSQEG